MIWFRCFWQKQCTLTCLRSNDIPNFLQQLGGRLAQLCTKAILPTLTQSAGSRMICGWKSGCDARARSSA